MPDEFDPSTEINAVTELDTINAQRTLRLECLRMVADRDIPADELIGYAATLVDWIMGSSLQ